MKSKIKKFSDFLMIKDAAEFLGVTENTLRNWDKNKKIKMYRHPINGYRLYDKDELWQLLSAIKIMEYNG